jgi:hypothetical protein
VFPFVAQTDIPIVAVSVIISVVATAVVVACLGLASCCRHR